MMTIGTEDGVLHELALWFSVWTILAVVLGVVLFFAGMCVGASWGGALTRAPRKPKKSAPGPGDAGASASPEGDEDSPVSDTTRWKA